MPIFYLGQEGERVSRARGTRSKEVYDSAKRGPNENTLSGKKGKTPSACDVGRTDRGGGLGEKGATGVWLRVLRKRETKQRKD